MTVSSHRPGTWVKLALHSQCLAWRHFLNLLHSRQYVCLSGVSSEQWEQSSWPPGAYTEEQMLRYISDYVLESVFQGKIRRCHEGVFQERSDFGLEGEFWKFRGKKCSNCVISSSWGCVGPRWERADLREAVGEGLGCGSQIKDYTEPPCPVQLQLLADLRKRVTGSVLSFKTVLRSACDKVQRVRVKERRGQWEVPAATQARHRTGETKERICEPEIQEPTSLEKLLKSIPWREDQGFLLGIQLFHRWRPALNCRTLEQELILKAGRSGYLWTVTAGYSNKDNGFHSFQKNERAIPAILIVDIWKTVGSLLLFLFLVELL